ncbi:hypothetical protein J4573_47445 [Actinomadura barringtoniae]|uniref:Uncharacterized protein n=1 Tax=Actinomadura barringtoniae TaxID=1427535 RepID=A0A939TFW0_9ACTN|nr:hypothetical protein [Actinomadura barringtoniae]MBO2454795.1 hypothetical protein [Actinomadura barringtoniae]
MKRKPLIALAGAVAGTALATAGVSALLAFDDVGGSGKGGDGKGDSSAAVRPARSYENAKEIAAQLRGGGASGCSLDPARVECRYGGRYVAAIVLGGTSGLTMATALESWKTGIGQSTLGEQNAFALLQGPNWLVTGPDDLIGKIRPALGGALVHCDRPYGTCT